MKRCWNCGYKIRDNDSFCPMCGVKQDFFTRVKKFFKSSFKPNSEEYTSSSEADAFNKSLSETIMSESRSSSVSASLASVESYNSMASESSNMANVHQSAMSYADLKLENSSYQSAMSNQAFSWDGNYEHYITNSMTHSYIHRYGRNARYAMSLKVASLSDVNDVLHHECLSSRASKLSCYEANTTSKSQKRAVVDNVNQYALSYAANSLNNNMIESKMRNETYSYDNNDRNSVANVMTEYYVDRYSDSAASIIASKLNELGSVSANIYNQYLASSTNAVELRSSVDNVRQLAMSYTDASLSNNKYVSALNHQKYSVSTSHKNKIVDSVTSDYLSEYSSGASATVQNQIRNENFEADITYQNYVASNSIAQFSEAIEDTDLLFRSITYHIILRRVLKKFREVKAHHKKLISNGGNEAIHFINHLNSKNRYKSNYLLNKYNHITQLKERFSSNALQNLSEIKKYEALTKKYMDKIKLVQLAKEIKFQLYADPQILSRYQSFNYIDTNDCVRYISPYNKHQKADNNNQYLSKMKARLEATCRTPYSHYYYEKIISRYLFDYKKVYQKIDYINSHLPNKIQLAKPNGMRTFSNNMKSFKWDFHDAQQGAKGEAIVKKCLNKHNIYPLTDVNIPFRYHSGKIEPNQIDLMTINNHGVFIFEVKSYNDSYIWINQRGQIAWSKHKHPLRVYHQWKNPILQQAKNHKRAFIYNIQNNLKKKIDQDLVHVILVYINKNQYHTKYWANKSIDLENTFLDRVKNQDECYECIDGWNGSILHRDDIKHLKDAMSLLQDKPFPHYELVGHYKIILNKVRDYVIYVNKLDKLCHRIFSKHFVQDKNDLSRDIKITKDKYDKYSKYKQAKNKCWYVYKDGHNHFVNDSKKNRNISKIINRYPYKLKKLRRLYNKFYN